MRIDENFNEIKIVRLREAFRSKHAFLRHGGAQSGFGADWLKSSPR
jgi:hypothetical protein